MHRTCPLSCTMRYESRELDNEVHRREVETIGSLMSHMVSIRTPRWGLKRFAIEHSPVACAQT